MSRSCQRATFSRPTSAFARTTRASPQMRSAVIGLRLCGIADEPFWPRPNGSSTSRTSVRARWRISVAKRSSDEASERQRREQLGVTVALEDLRRARRRLEAEPLAGDPLDLGLGGRVRADGARELADAHALDRAHEPLPVAVERERPAGELEPERRRLGVDAVRAAHAERLPVLLGAGDDGARTRGRGPRARALPRPARRARAPCRARPTRSARSGTSGRRRRAPRRRRRRTPRRRGSSRARSRRPAPASARRARRGSRATASRRDDADLAQPSSAASSTSSHPAQPRLVRPDPAMAGRE